MTQSDKIIEFLKYASPRLDYIEHCMEKQALSPTKALQAIKAFRARASTGAIDPSKYKRIGALSKSVGKLKGKEKNQLNNVSGKLHKKYYDGKYVKGDYSRVQQRAAAPSFEESYFNQYGRMPDADMVRQSTVPAPKAPTWQDEFYARNGYLPEQHVNSSSNVSPAMLGAKKPAAGGNAAKPDAANAGAANANDAAEPGMWGNITAWAKEHPYLTVGGGVAAGAAAGGGLGYGLGHGAGQQDGAQTAQRYYELREALDRQRLRQTNDSFLSRLANLFGTGELSNMIG